MRDDGILDAVVDIARKHAAIEQILFCPVGAKANDAPGPTRRQAGNLGKFLCAGVVDVHARLRRHDGFGLLRVFGGHRLRGSRLRMTECPNCSSGGACHEHDDCRELDSSWHAPILRLLMGRQQEKQGGRQEKYLTPLGLCPYLGGDAEPPPSRPSPPSWNNHAGGLLWPELTRPERSKRYTQARRRMTLVGFSRLEQEFNPNRGQRQDER
jgi:hypothetical protein